MEFAFGTLNRGDIRILISSRSLALENKSPWSIVGRNLVILRLAVGTITPCNGQTDGQRARVYTVLA